MCMKIRIRRLSSFTLISLLSFFSFAAQTGTQDKIFGRLSGLPELRGTSEKTQKAAAVASSDYSYSVLYSFCSAPNCTDGATPAAGLIQDGAGNLFGTTTAGGGNSNPSCGSNGCGTVFKLDNTGHETVVYSFCSAPNCTDGAAPQAEVIQDAAGNLYGTTSIGGANGGGGTVFKVTPNLIITGTPVIVSPGATAASTITVTPGKTFTGRVDLTAAVTSSPAGAQDLPMLSFGSTSPVSITGASAGTAILTITTTAATSGVL